MDFLSLSIGDEIAVLPTRHSLPTETLYLAKVVYAGTIFFQLDDGRMFAVIGGQGLDNHCYIAPATDEHRAAIEKRSSSAQDSTRNGRKHPGRRPGIRNR